MKQEEPFQPFRVDPSWYEKYWLENVPVDPSKRPIGPTIVVYVKQWAGWLRTHWRTAMQARLRRVHLDEI